MQINTESVMLVTIITHSGGRIFAAKESQS